MFRKNSWLIEYLKAQHLRLHFVKRNLKADTKNLAAGPQNYLSSLPWSGQGPLYSPPGPTLARYKICDTATSIQQVIHSHSFSIGLKV